MAAENESPDARQLVDLIGESATEEILRADRENETWTFDDVCVNAGLFGKVVDSKFIIECGNGYKISEPKKVERSLNNDSVTTQASWTNRLLSKWISRHKRSSYKDPYILALVTVTLIGLVLRGYQVGAASFWLDENWTVWAAHNFLEGNGFSEPSGTPYRRSWLTVSLPIAAAFSIAGTSELAARFPSVIVGTATLPVVYWLGRELVNRPTGLLLAAVSAVDPWMLTWSREARMYAHFQFLMMLGLLLFYYWYMDGRLSLTSRWGWGFAMLFPIGFVTHRGYALLGMIVLIFSTVSCGYYIYQQVAGIAQVSHHIRRHLFVIGASIFGIIAFLSIRGVPDLLLGETPDWYGGTTTNYYWQALESLGAVPDAFNEILLFLGALYLLIAKRERGALLLTAFVVPYFVQTYAISWRISRYIFHVYPLYLLVCLSTIVMLLNTLLKWIKGTRAGSVGQKLRQGELLVPISRFVLDTDYSNVVVIVAILLTAQMLVPVGDSVAFLSENPHGTLENRPDYKSVSEYMGGRLEEGDVVVASTPALAQWYLGRAEYSLSPLRYSLNESGVAVDQRTGTTVLNSTEDVRNLTSQESGWIIADHRLRWYADDSVQEAVDSSSVRVDNGQWRDIALYRFGPATVNVDSDNDLWRRNVVNIDGNVYSTLNKPLVIGRTVKTNTTWRQRGETTTGSITLKMSKLPGKKITVKMVTYVNREVGRTVKIAVSTDRQQWTDATPKLQDGWNCYRSQHDIGDTSDEFYVRLSGGGNLSSNMGVLVEELTVHPTAYEQLDQETSQTRMCSE